ncbi:MAG: VCBS repeat-containing protein [Gemmataceae bacterium]
MDSSDGSAQAASAQSTSGFSLLQLSILLALAGILVATMIPGKDAGDQNAKTLLTLERIQRIEDATKGFMAAHHRRPCPASGQYPETIEAGASSQYFGVEAATPGTCTGGTPAADFGPSSNVVAGVVPVRTLGLPDEYMYDGWGRRFTYVVDKRATSDTQCAATTSGSITVKATSGGSTLANTMVLYISHGKDGFGAFPAAGSSVANRLNVGSSDTDQRENASVDINFVASFDVNFVKKEATSSFDDIVWYPTTANTAGRIMANRCCLGATCPSAIRSCAMPWDGNVYFPYWLGPDPFAGNNYINSYNVYTHTFGIPIPYTGYDQHDAYTSYFSAGDINGDGVDDIGFGAYNAYNYTNNYEIHNGANRSSILYSWSGPTGTMSGGMLFGYNDTDNNIDFYTGTGAYSGLNGSLLHSGLHADAGAATVYHATGDFDGDRVDDTAIISGLGVLLSSGVNGSTIRTISVPNPNADGYRCRIIAAGDITGDGIADIACYRLDQSSYASPNYYSTAYVELYDGVTGAKFNTITVGQSYTFGNAPVYSTGVLGLAVRDVNADGHADVLALIITHGSTPDLQLTGYLGNYFAYFVRIYDGPTGNILSTSPDLKAASNTPNGGDFGSLTYGGLAASPSCTSTNTNTICLLPWGGTTGSGTSVTAYSAATSGSCYGCGALGETRTCTNGVLSGSYTNQNCSGTCSACALPWGGTTPHNTSVTAYANGHPWPADCADESRACDDGTLSGSYTFQACDSLPGCDLPWGGSIYDADSVTAYSTGSVPYGYSCSSESRTCTNGTLSGSYAFAGCTPDPPPPCHIDWADGGSADVNDGDSIVAYFSSGDTVDYEWQYELHGAPPSLWETRTCSAGVLSGSATYQYPSLSYACALNDGTFVAWGNSVDAYYLGYGAFGPGYGHQIHPPMGQTCSQQLMHYTCDNNWAPLYFGPPPDYAAYSGGDPYFGPTKQSCVEN